MASTIDREQERTDSSLFYIDVVPWCGITAVHTFSWILLDSWWQDNVNWRRNTMFAVGAMAVIGVTVAVWADHHVVSFTFS